MFPLGVAAAQSAAPGAADATIRIYNYAKVPGDQLEAARSTADGIFEAAGISLTWIDCRVPGGRAGAACTEGLREGGEFVLRLLESSTRGTGRRVALGSSLIDRRAGGGVLITIDPRLILTVARQAKAEPSVLLGRALAHELGHLLIGTTAHARAGLMRALWSQSELRGGRPADWRFSPEEARLMRHTLVGGARRAN
jgi:hypothetical protein